MSGSDEMPPSPFEVLNFLCVTLARKPPAVSFRQGAAVARYLDDLGHELVPGRERQRILLLSRAVRGMVFQFSKFKTATKEEAIDFLEHFRQTHLATYNVEGAVKTVSSAKVLKRHVFPTVLRSPGQSVTLGSGMGRYSDDLSERICAAYWTLRFAGIYGARKHVALALNHYGIRTRSSNADSAWTGFEVTERVKQYEARFFAKRKRDVARRFLVGKWSRIVYYPIKVHNPYKPRDDSGLL